MAWGSMKQREDSGAYELSAVCPLLEQQHLLYLSSGLFASPVWLNKLYKNKKKGVIYIDLVY